MIVDITLLRENELFGPLAGDELSIIAPACSTFSVIEDGLLFTEGRTASHLYLVAEGQIALQKAVRAPHRRRSRRTTIGLCRPGEVVGWSALVEPYKHPLSATAWESSKLIRVDSKLLRKAMDMHPEIGYKVMVALSVVVSRRLAQLAHVLASERERSVFGDDPVEDVSDLFPQLM